MNLWLTPTLEDRPRIGSLKKKKANVYISIIAKRKLTEILMFFKLFLRKKKLDKLVSTEGAINY